MDRKKTRKVVYNEGSGIKTIRGKISFVDNFVEVTTDSGEILINKQNVIAIKEELK